MNRTFHWPVIILFIGFAGTSCQQTPSYRFVRVIELGEVAPTGMVVTLDGFWISEARHNRLIKYDWNGNTIEVLRGFRRPMRIAMLADTLYVPEYLIDSVTVVVGGMRRALDLPLRLDAPAAVDDDSHSYAIADFYNHRVILVDDDSVHVIGRPGHGPGELHYPTDIALIGNKEMRSSAAP